MQLSNRTSARLLGTVLSCALIATACGGGGGGGGGGNGVPVPSGLIASPGSGQVTLAWSAVPGAQSYTVYRGASSGLTTASTQIGGLVASGAVVNGLTNGVLQYFAVTATFFGTESAFSAEVTARPAAPSFRLLDTSPNAFDDDVSTNTSLSFTFSGPIAPATATAPGAVKLQTGSIYAPVDVPCTLTFHGSTMVVTPNAPLAPGTKHRVFVARTVADAGGEPLPGPAAFEEETGAAADTTPPTVLAVTPANGTATAPVTTAFEVTFSEDVRAEDVTAANVTLTQGATPVAVAHSQPSSSKIQLKPTAALAAGATFRLTVGTGVRDRAGNALGAAFVADVTTAAAPPPGRTTSYMIYVSSAGDSLENILVNDLNAWEAAGGSTADANVRMYAQMDAANATNAPRVPATPFHVRLQRDADRNVVTSPALRAVPAGDLTTPAAVSDFILACNADFAAQRNVLVFSNHGMNYTGTNAAPGGNQIELPEIVTALTTARNAGVTFDVIVFDVCVMGGWEDLALVAPFANLIVAGETTTTGMEWEAFYTQTFLPNTAADSLTLMRDLVDKTVAARVGSANAEPNDFFVYDCTKVPALKTATVAFYNELNAALVAATVTAAQFADAFNASLPLVIFSDGEREMCDLLRLCEQLIALPGAPAVLKTRAQSVVDAIREAVVHARTSALWAKLCGVSAALGKVNNAVLGPILQAISPGMSNPTAAAETARAAHFGNVANQPTAAVARSANTTNPLPGAPLELEITATNGEGALIYGVISKETAPASGIFTFLGVNIWTDDVESNTEWSWDGRVVTLTDGTTTDFAPGFPVDFESALVQVEAELTEAGTGNVVSALIIIDISAPRIEAVFSDALGVGKAFGVAELRPGDTLRILTQRWNEAADDVQQIPSSLVLTVGAAGLASLTAAFTPVTSGTYEYGVVVEDPEGHDDEVSVTVTVP